MHTCKECGGFASHLVPEDFVTNEADPDGDLLTVPESYWCDNHIQGKEYHRPLMNTKPVHVHDCDTCIYLGTIKPRTTDGKATDTEQFIDCYWCADTTHPGLSSVIGRYGSEGSEYASSHPPESFAMKYDYLLIADRWYLFALMQGYLRGLWGKTRKEIEDAKEHSKGDRRVLESQSSQG